MRVVLLGGGGYLGRRLTAELQSAGENDVVIAEKRFLPSRQPSDPAISLIEMDWKDTESVQAARGKIGRADGIVHLAFPDTHSLQGADADTEKAKVREGMARLLDLAADVGCWSFFHVSTAKVYGRTLPNLVDESIAVHPEDLYAELHHTAEEALQESDFTRSRACVSFRLTNSFGCPADKSTSRWDLIVNEMCMSAVTESSIRLGDGALSYRDFVPVAHAVKVLSGELASRAVTARAAGKWMPINLCAGHSMTLEGMAQRIQQRARQVLGKEVAVIPSGGAMPQSEVIFRSLHLPALGNAEFEQLTNTELDATLKRCREWFA